MRSQAFDDLTARAAASLSRRASLMGLGGAALAAMAVSAPARGKPSKTAKKVKRKCRQQIGQCETSVESLCPRLSVGTLVCEAALRPCCASFQGCQADAAYDCLIRALLALEQSAEEAEEV